MIKCIRRDLSVSLISRSCESCPGNLQGVFISNNQCWRCRCIWNGALNFVINTCRISSAANIGSSNWESICGTPVKVCGVWYCISHSSGWSGCTEFCITARRCAALPYLICNWVVTRAHRGTGWSPSWRECNPVNRDSREILDDCRFGESLWDLLENVSLRSNVIVAILIVITLSAETINEVSS